MTKYSGEIAIIGSGLAGLVSAIELLDNNKKVVIFDRDTPEKLGGLAKWSFGGMFFVNTKHQRRTGIKDSIELAKRDWYSFAEFGEEDIWQKRWADHFIEECTPMIYQWLKERGVSFFPVVHWVERGLWKPGNSVPRFHMVWGTGHWLVEAMIQVLKTHKNASNCEIKFHHRVDDIKIEGGQIKGVSGTNELSNEQFSMNAEHVIVASGGVCGNIDKVKENWYQPWGNAPETILNGSHPVADGALIDLVSEYNGSVKHMDKYWHYAAGVHNPKPEFEGHGLSIVPPKSALWLNYQGERMGPIPLVSAFDTRYLVERICQEEKKYSWQVLNYKIALKEFAISGSASNEAMKEKNLFKFLKTILFGNKKLVDDMIANCDDFVIANSVEELADKMNKASGDSFVDKQKLKASIENYDSMILRGSKFHNDEQLRRITQLRQYRGDKARVCKYQAIDDKNAYPLIAIKEYILSRKSLGGIETDLDSKVLVKSDGPTKDIIPGLYATGESAGFGGGGMHGMRALEGTFLGGCVLTGRKAAQSIVKG
jgi:hypothetical protein